MGWGAAVAAALGIADKGLGLYSMSKQARYQKEYAKYVGENAHQWEVNDLRNAGLNPILSSGGSGNAGGAVHVGSLDGDMANTFTNVLNSAQQRHLLSEQVKTEKQKQDLMSSEEYKNLRLGHLYGAQEYNTTAQSKLLDLQIPVAERNTEYQLSNYGNFTYGLGMLTNSAGALIGKLPSMK